MTARDLAFFLGLAAIVTEFTVSANLLSGMGVAYVSEGGPIFVKLHPGFYLAGAAAAARLWDAAMARRCGQARVPGLGAIAVCIAGFGFCCVYASVLHGIGNAVALLDTFLTAGMLCLALAGLAPAHGALLRRTVMVLLAANAGVALLETLLQMHAIPIDPPIPEAVADFRPTALYDHPLTGAAVTLAGLFMAPDFARRPVLSSLYVAWLGAALLAFGGRAALVVAAAAFGGRYAYAIATHTLHRRLGLGHVLPVGAGVALVVVGALLVAGGFVPRLEGHLYWDPSAQSRLDQFAILGQLTRDQWLLGCDRADLIAMIEPMRLQSGVDVLESFWLLMFVTLGALGFPAFLLAIGGLVRTLWRISDGDGRLMLVAVLVTASASNSLARKSTLLAILVACAYGCAAHQRGVRAQAAPARRMARPVAV